MVTLWKPAGPLLSQRGSERSGKTCPNHRNVAVRIPIRRMPVQHRSNITASRCKGKIPIVTIMIYLVVESTTLSSCVGSRGLIVRDFVRVLRGQSRSAVAFFVLTTRLNKYCFSETGFFTMPALQLRTWQTAHASRGADAAGKYGNTNQSSER